jgi:manganese efflux pump family protein
MSFLSNFLLALGVAMDAFTVSMSRSTIIRPFRVIDALKFAVFFGGFQALMLLLGWLGYTIKNYVSAYGQWIASSILVFIGIKMIYEAFYRKPKGKLRSLNYSVLFMLAVATSIDAFFVGISFTFLQVPILEPTLIVGCVTFIMVFCGAIMGYRLGQFFRNEAEILGGLILIGLGISSLILNN